MGVETRSVVVRLSMETAQAIRNSKEFGSEMGKAMDQAERSTVRADQAVDHLASTAGKMALVTTGALVASGKAAVDWESQFAGVEKTVDGTRTQLDGLEDDLREMARSMPATHQEIAATAEAAGQLGVATEDVADFTEVMVQMGETTNLTADGAATDIAQLMNVMQTVPGEVDEIANTIVDLGNKGASTESQILSMAQRVAGAGALIGASEADVLALSAAMANLGIESELGGGAVQRVLVGINTQVASSGKYLEGYAEIAGTSAQEFATAWSTDPVRAFDSFIQGLGRIQASGGDVASTLESVGIKGTQNLQVMLRLAGAGDSLTTALDQSAEAWEENSALSEEFAKRAGTTAAEMQVAMNNIRDAGIEVGAALLPVVSEVSEAVSGMAGAFSQAPQPIQSTVTGLLAVTAITTGAAWFGSKVVRGVRDTRDALSDLGITADRTEGLLGRVGRAGVKLAGVATAVGLLSEALNSATSNRVNASDLARDLEALANGANDSFLKDLNNDLDVLAQHSGALDTAAEGFYEVAGGIGQVVTLGQFFDQTGLDQAQADIEAIDQQLASLVESGNAERAYEMFAAIMEAHTGMSAATTQFAPRVSEFDAYATALDNAASSADDASGSNDQYTGSAGEAGDAASGAAQDIGKLVDAMLNQRDAALSAFDAQTQWGQAVMDAREQAASGAKGLNQFTEAGQRNRAALSDLASAWNNQSAAVRNNEAQYAAARKTFINVAESMGVPRKAARALADELLAIPKSTVAKIKVEDEQARTALSSIGGWLDSLDGKTARTYIDVIRRGYQAKNNAFDVAVPQADGGTVPGERYPYGDKTLILAAPGEEVITNRNGEADRFRADRAAGRIPAYAGGGTVGSATFYAAGDSNRSLDDRLAIAQALQEVRDLGRQLADRVDEGKNKGRFETRGLDRDILEMQLQVAKVDLRRAQNREAREAKQAVGEAKQSLDLATGLPSALSLTPGQQAGLEVRETLEAFRDEIRDAGGKVGKGFDTLAMKSAYLTMRYTDNAEKIADLTAEMESIRSTAAGSFMNDALGGSLYDFDTQVAADTNDANAMTTALQQAYAKGLDGPLGAAIAQSGNLLLAQEFAGLDAAGIAQREAAYAARDSAGVALGEVAVQMSGLAGTVNTLAAENAKLIGQLAGMQQKIKDGVYEGAYDGTAQREKDRNGRVGARAGAGR